MKKPSLSQVDKGRGITDARYVIIDTELTGLNERKDSIISIGAVKMGGMKIELGNTFHQLIKPEAEFKPDSVIVHGITPSDVVEKPNIDPILAEFLLFCGSDIIVGHCVSIDISFINRETKRLFGETVQNPLIDTFRVYEWLKKKLPTRSCFSSAPKDSALYEIAKCFDIPVRSAHDALADSFITAQLFQRFIPVLLDLGIRHVGELLDLGKPREGGDTFSISGEITNF